MHHTGQPGKAWTLKFMIAFLSQISRGLSFLGRYAPQAMALGVFAGLVLPTVADTLRPWLTPAVWLLLYLAMMRIAWRDLVERMRRPVLSAALVFWMLIVTPAIVAGALAFFDIRPGLVAAMVLAASSAALFSTPSLGVMFGLDGALLLIVLVVGTLLVPVTLPLMASLLMGFDLGAETSALMMRLGGLVLSAAVCAVITRRILGEVRVSAARQTMDGVSVVLLIIFAVGIMSGVTARILADPMDIAYVAMLSFILYIGLMILGFAVFALAAPGVGRRGSLSAGFISGTRNLALILAVLPANVDPDLPLFFAVAQFPIYIMPLVLRPVFRSLLGSPAKA